MSIVHIYPREMKLGDRILLRRCGQSCSCRLCPILYKITGADAEDKHWILTPEKENDESMDNMKKLLDKSVLNMHLFATVR